MKKHNIIIEVDEQIRAGYIYLAGHKVPPQVTSTEQLTNKKGIVINLDYNGDKLIGIEILDVDKNLMIC